MVSSSSLLDHAPAGTEALPVVTTTLHDNTTIRKRPRKAVSKWRQTQPTWRDRLHQTMEAVFETLNCDLLFKTILGLGLGVVVSVAIFGVPSFSNHRFYRHSTKPKQNSVCQTVLKSDYTKSDWFVDIYTQQQSNSQTVDYSDIQTQITLEEQGHSTSGCPGLCVWQERNLLVPCKTHFSDGCNDCWYNQQDGGVACTKRGCSYGCFHNSFYYQPHETIVLEDGDACNTCTCSELSQWEEGKSRYHVTCTQKACGTCQFRGSVYKMGQTFEDLCHVPYQTDDEVVECGGDDDAAVACDDDDDATDDDTTDDTAVEEVQNMCTCHSDGIVNCTYDNPQQDDDYYNYDDYYYQGDDLYAYRNGQNYWYEPQQGTYGYYEYRKYYGYQTNPYAQEEDEVDDYPYCFDTERCVYQGNVYQYHQCFLSKDKINQCACLESGKVACTACELY